MELCSYNDVRTKTYTVIKHSEQTAAFVYINASPCRVHKQISVNTENRFKSNRSCRHYLAKSTPYTERYGREYTHLYLGFRRFTVFGGPKHDKSDKDRAADEASEKRTTTARPCPDRGKCLLWCLGDNWT